LRRRLHHLVYHLADGGSGSRRPHHCMQLTWAPSEWRDDCSNCMLSCGACNGFRNRYRSAVDVVQPLTLAKFYELRDHIFKERKELIAASHVSDMAFFESRPSERARRSSRPASITSIRVFRRSGTIADGFVCGPPQPNFQGLAAMPALFVLIDCDQFVPGVSWFCRMKALSL